MGEQHGRSDYLIIWIVRDSQFLLTSHSDLCLLNAIIITIPYRYACIMKCIYGYIGVWLSFQNLPISTVHNAQAAEGGSHIGREIVERSKGDIGQSPGRRHLRVDIP
jgi:hypothetical protein